MTTIKDNSVAMPIKEKPYVHQKEAFEFACDLFGVSDGVIKSPGVALLMEMGTGKTLVAIAVAGILFQLNKIGKVLIVAPLSVLSVWKQEFEKFAEFPYSIIVLEGSVSKKKTQLSSLQNEELQIVAVNYESSWRMEKELLAYNADLIIADEGHKLKDSRTKQSETMHKLGDKAKYKMLLTGTAITNRELDIFSEYRFLNPQIFGESFWNFRSKYFYMSGYGNHTPVFRASKTDEFTKLIRSIAYRALKKDCLDLPEVTEELRDIELECKARKTYDSIKKKSFAELADSEVTANNVLTKLMRLSQITGGHLTDDNGISQTVSTAKLDALSDIIDSCIEEDKKLVIMARFVPELDDIENLLEKKKISYAVIRGGTKNRENEVDRFQYDKKCKVFLGQIEAAGLGITLTAASIMVFYSLDYSYANFDQAKARIHRTGQKEKCQYIYLTCKDTVDYQVLEALQNKQDLARKFIDDFQNKSER